MIYVTYISKYYNICILYIYYLLYLQQRHSRMKGKRNIRCYNSGKIGGLPYEEVERKFALADREIRDMGLVPASPLRNGLNPSRPWLLHMAVDICMMASCGNIYLQRDWRTSRGARIEYRIALFLGMGVWFADNPGCEKKE